VIKALLMLGFPSSHRGASALLEKVESVYWPKKDADVLKGMSMRLLSPQNDRENVALKGILAALDLYGSR
jgi:hypothetical protein